MAEQVFKSPGVTTREIDLTGPGTVSPQGIPAGVIGTAQKGPAFVPVTFATYKDFVTKFGGTDGKLFGPMAVSEWMSNARAGTYLRVLGIGDGKRRNTTNSSVTNAGFAVGQQLVQADGDLGHNPNATATKAGSASDIAAAELATYSAAVTADLELRVLESGVTGTNLKTGAGGVVSNGVNDAPGGLYMKTASHGDYASGATTKVTITLALAATGFLASDGVTPLANHTITFSSQTGGTFRDAGRTPGATECIINSANHTGGNMTAVHIAQTIIQAFKRDSGFDYTFGTSYSGRAENQSIKWGSGWQLSSSTASGDIASVFIATDGAGGDNQGVKLTFRGSQGDDTANYLQNHGIYGGPRCTAVADSIMSIATDGSANTACHTTATADAHTAGTTTDATSITITDGSTTTTYKANDTVANKGWIVGSIATNAANIAASLNDHGAFTVTASTPDVDIKATTAGVAANSTHKVQVNNNTWLSLNDGGSHSNPTAAQNYPLEGGADAIKRKSKWTFTSVPLEGDTLQITDGTTDHFYCFGTDSGMIDISGATTVAHVAKAVVDHLANASVNESTPTAVANTTLRLGYSTAALARANGTTYQSAWSSGASTYTAEWVAGVVNIEQQTAGSTALTLSEADATSFAAALGRTYFLAAVMEDSNESGYLFDAGLGTPGANAILRGCLMIPSGVVPALSGWGGSRLASVSDYAFDDFGATLDAGSQVGTVDLRANGDENFVMFLNGFSNTTDYSAILTASMSPLSPNYFPKVFNTDPTKIEEQGHYLYTYYDIHPQIAQIAPEDAQKTNSGITDHADDKASDVYHRLLLLSGSAARNTFTTSGTDYLPNFEGFQDRFAHAVSPYVISQTLGTAVKNLFRFHALDAGVAGNTQYKISIANIKKSTDPVSDYGTFDVYIRKFKDSDEDMQILEKYIGIDLNPASDRYIGRIIGTQNVYFDFEKQTANQKLVIDGLYPNRSLYVRVEVVDDIENAVMEPTALPLGFRGKKHLVLDGTKPLSPLDNNTGTGIAEHTLASKIYEPPVPFRKNLTQGSGNTAKVDSRYFWGVQFEKQTDATERNKSTEHDSLIANFTKYFPSFGSFPAYVGDNTGTADSNSSVLDADRYNQNLFSLERVLVKCKDANLASAVDPREWDEAVYIRSGSAPKDGDYLENDGETKKLSTTGYRFLNVAKDFAQQASRRYYKYTFFMQGGYDGLNILSKDISEMNGAAAHREMRYATTQLGAAASTVAAYRKALDIMAEKSDVDIQLLAIPGIREPGVTDYAIDKTEERFDALYIMDIEECEHAGQLASNILTGSLQEISVTNTVGVLQDRNLDTSFAASYFPDVVMTDQDTGSNVQVPPSVAVLGAFSLNDSVAHPWFAPAGFSRGALANAVESQVKLSRVNMDALYEVDINPITSFPTSEGVVVFGQKTLLQAQSSLDRVNVRRLLIDIRRKVKKVANTILFEPNRESTLARFSAAVQPILTTIQAQQGLDRFKVVIDTTTTSQQDVENNTVRGKIFLQPTRAVEFISLDFVVTNAGTEI
tara:strand:+ start:27299 stop:31900 length:4602 start_codon:yes stop_codon:yes gene_type:complete